MNSLFLVCNIIQALSLIAISFALVIIALQLREIAKIYLFASDVEAGVEIPEQPEQKEDYTIGASSLADLLNTKLKEELGDGHENYMQNTRGTRASYELDNDFGITGVEVITDEDETKPKGE